MKSRILGIFVLIAFVLTAFATVGCEKEDPTEDNTQTEKPYVFYAHDPESDALMNKTDGFIKGVCHPSDNYEQIKAANIKWIRRDVPFLYNKDGTISQSYLAYKERMTNFANNGISVLAITPYPDDYIDYGLDPRDPENEQAIKDIAVYYLNDLRDCVSGFQITNEMGVEHFTYPLTMAEAARFIGIQLEAIFPLRGDILVGYNNGGISGYAELNDLMQPYLPYCDYVGLDIYLGCFDSIFKDIAANLILADFVYDIVQKPIIFTEFGYIGLGQQKTADERNEILRGYGYDSEEAARADMENFYEKLTPKLQAYLDKTADDYEDMAHIMFDTEMANHLYLEIQSGYQLNEYEHTEAGQAKFFTDAIEDLMSVDYICGAFVYCYSDSDSCYLCGQNHCPVETAWGLVDSDGNPKPSYYAVQAAFAKEKVPE